MKRFTCQSHKLVTLGSTPKPATKQKVSFLYAALVAV